MSNSNLDQTAAELGMGGKLAPERDDAGYRKRMERRQQVQRQRVEERNKDDAKEGGDDASRCFICLERTPFVFVLYFIVFLRLGQGPCGN